MILCSRMCIKCNINKKIMKKRLYELFIFATKNVVRLLTRKKTRCHNRRLFFQTALKNLTFNHGSFAGITCDKYTFKSACRELAGDCSFHPTHKEYVINDLNSYFAGEHNYDSLRLLIIRETPVLSALIHRRGNYVIKVEAEKAGSKISYDYAFTYFVPKN